MLRACRRCCSAVGWQSARPIVFAGLLIALCQSVRAQELTTPQRATSSGSARKEAIAAMPLGRLDPAMQQTVAAVLSKPSVYRRMPVSVIRCDPELYLYILNHPEIVANIWQLMEIENVVLQTTGPNTYLANDGDGTQGALEFLHRSHDTHLIFAKGTYDGPLFTQPITGTSVMLLRTSYAREPDGNYYVATQLDAFVQLDNVGLDFLAKTFQPLVCRVADYNFLVTAQFVEALSRTAELNERGMQRLAANLQNLDPQVRHEFAALAREVSQRALARTELGAEPQARLADQHPLPMARTIE